MIAIKGRLWSCATHEQQLRLGKGPHKYQLWCKVCNQHTQWISTKQAIKIGINTIAIERSKA